MHSPAPMLDDERAVLVVTRQVRSAGIPQVGGTSPVLGGCEQEAFLRRRDLPDQGARAPHGELGRLLVDMFYAATIAPEARKDPGPENAGNENPERREQRP
jgi:hypothetical protein